MTLPEDPFRSMSGGDDTPRTPPTMTPLTPAASLASPAKPPVTFAAPAHVEDGAGDPELLRFLRSCGLDALAPQFASEEVTTHRHCRT